MASEFFANLSQQRGKIEAAQTTGEKVAAWQPVFSENADVTPQTMLELIGVEHVYAAAEHFYAVAKDRQNFSADQATRLFGQLITHLPKTPPNLNGNDPGNRLAAMALDLIADKSPHLAFAKNEIVEAVCGSGPVSRIAQLMMLRELEAEVTEKLVAAHGGVLPVLAPQN